MCDIMPCSIFGLSFFLCGNMHVVPFDATVSFLSIVRAQMLVKVFSLYLCVQLIKRVSFIYFDELAPPPSRFLSVRFISRLVTVIEMVVFIVANFVNELNVMGRGGIFCGYTYFLW